MRGMCSCANCRNDRNAKDERVVKCATCGEQVNRSDIVDGTHTRFETDHGMLFECGPVTPFAQNSPLATEEGSK